MNFIFKSNTLRTYLMLKIGAMGNMKLKNIDLYFVLLTFVGLTSAINIFLLSIGYFSSSLVLALSIPLTLLTQFFYGRKFKASTINLKLLLILVLAVFLRMDLFPHFLGGQDQGLYVAMSATMERSGSIQFVDHFRESLNSELKTVYDKYEVGSVSLLSKKHSLFTIDFYPLLPSWMAISKFIFGFGKHTLVILLFSLIGIIGTFKFTKELVPNLKDAPYLAAFFVAINPGLVFLGKFPVTEGVAFSLVVNAAYLLLLSLREKNDLKIPALVTSLLLINAFLYLRMSFLILVPTMVLLFILSFKSTLNGNRFILRSFVFIFSLLLIINLIFYYAYQPVLFFSIYDTIFKPILGENTLIVFFVAILVLAIFISVFSEKLKISRVIDSITDKEYDFFRYFVFLLILLSLPSIIKFKQTGLFSLFPFPTLASEFRSVRFHLLFRYIALISPFFFLALFLPLKFNFKVNKTVKILILNLVFFYFIVLGWSPVFPYFYYYGRYLLSELVPYTLIIVAIFLATLKNTPNQTNLMVYKFILFSGALYFIIFSGMQLGRKEGDNGEFFKSIANTIKTEDVLIVKESEILRDITDPLKHYFNKNVFVLRNSLIPIDQQEEVILSLIKKTKGNVWFLVQGGKISGNGIDLVLKNEVLTNGEHAWSNGIGKENKLSYYFLPLKEAIITRKYQLIKVGEKDIQDWFIVGSNGLVDFSSKGYSGRFITDGWGSQEESYRWTTGKESKLKVQFTSGHKLSNVSLMKIRGHVYSKKGSQLVSIKLNDQYVFEGQLKDAFNLNIDLSKHHIPSHPMEITFYTPDSYSPASIGEGTDTRELGVAISLIQFK